jgi:tetratricopeptide (TPR) repeat protein
VPKQDWFRKTTWSSEDEADFFAHLKRSRTDFHRAQYLAIQAWTLQRAEKPAAALPLLEKAIEEYPKERATMVRLCHAECLWSLGEAAASLAAYRSAVNTQREHPNELFQTALSFAERFHDYQDGAHRIELLDNLHEEIQRSVTFGFPMIEFRYSVVLARLFAATGDLNAASHWAQRALAAQSRKESDFRYHRSMGLVKGVEELTEVWLRRLVADGPGFDSTHRL